MVDSALALRPLERWDGVSDEGREKSRIEIPRLIFPSPIPSHPHDPSLEKINFLPPSLYIYMFKKKDLYRYNMKTRKRNQSNYHT